MTECPEEFEICFTNNEWIEFHNYVEFDDAEAFIPKHPIGDAEAVANFTWEILFLSPWELIYIAMPMSVLACYGLTIYYTFKWIQRKFSNG
jgi:hypothetical protein